jgi:hypothetical protein
MSGITITGDVTIDASSFIGRQVGLLMLALDAAGYTTARG